jgi:outer membrane protein OmpA-like peptidoglycan-associated protein
MKRAFVVLGMVAAAATTARAQRSFAYEAGLFAEYTKFADTTNLKSNIGGGVRAGIFVLPKIELEYEASLIPTSSATQSSLKAWNNRIDAVLNWPLAQNTMLLIGTGFTGTNYKGDTTHNAYDSGWNVLVGIRQCMGSSWSWRIDGVADFKNPSDQVFPTGPTQTYSGRVGVSWFIGGPAKNSPCSPAVAAAPAPAPAPPPPPAPAPAPAPAPVRPAPAPEPAAPPPPPPAPAPARARELFTLKGVLFEFNKSTLTKGARDTLGVAVRYLKDHGDARVEVQGHTDSKGSDEYNMKLGERRAESVKSYLTKQGIAADRISTRSFGKSDPVADNEIDGKDNPAGRALNRRVVIIELP